MIFFGAGFAIVGDRSALINANQNQINLYGSYHKSLNKSQEQYLSAGVSLGILQRNLNYENLFFNDQFNGLDDYSLGTAENLPPNNFAFMDLGLGVSYTTKVGSRSGFALGLAIDHIPGASISFFQRTDDDDIEYPDARLDRKFTGYFSAELASHERISILPRVIWQMQGPHQMIAGAALIKFDITNYDSQALQLGAGFRLNQGAEGGIQPSAVYALAAYQIEGFLLGLSHDISLSKFASENPGRGAFEVSISFTGLYENEDQFCPTF